MTTGGGGPASGGSGGSGNGLGKRIRYAVGGVLIAGTVIAVSVIPYLANDQRITSLDHKRYDAAVEGNRVDDAQNTQIGDINKSISELQQGQIVGSGRISALEAAVLQTQTAATATATPSPRPTASPTVAPTPTPMPTAAPAPTATLIPAATPTATPSPMPTAAPAPTATPTLTPTYTAAATPTPAVVTVLYNGCIAESQKASRPQTPYFSPQTSDRNQSVIDITRQLLPQIYAATGASQAERSKLELTLNEAGKSGNRPLVVLSPNAVAGCTDIGVFAITTDGKVASGLYLKLSRSDADRLAPQYGMPSPLQPLIK